MKHHIEYIILNQTKNDVTANLVKSNRKELTL